LGYPNPNDRTIINVLKSLDFLDDTGIPKKRYHEYLDQTQSALVLATGIREAYEDLFRLNTKANEMTATEVKNKMKTLSEGQFSDRVLQQMALTFTSLSKLGDFSGVPKTPKDESDSDDSDASQDTDDKSNLRIRGLVYNINLHLPESRDPAVYDALFKSLRQHLI
jgi:hypothetical protein